MREPEPVRETVAHALSDACEADAVVEGEKTASVGEGLADGEPLSESVAVDAGETEVEPDVHVEALADGELAPEAVKDSVVLDDRVRLVLAVPDKLPVIEPE